MDWQRLCLLSESTNFAPPDSELKWRGRGTCAVRIGCTTQLGEKELSKQRIGFATKVATRET